MVYSTLDNCDVVVITLTTETQKHRQSVLPFRFDFNRSNGSLFLSCIRNIVSNTQFDVFCERIKAVFLPVKERIQPEARAKVKEWKCVLQDRGVHTPSRKVTRAYTLIPLEGSSAAVIQGHCCCCFLLFRGLCRPHGKKMYSGQAIVLRNLRQIPPNTAKVIRLQKQFIEAVQRYQVSLSLHLISLRLVSV